MLQKDGEDNLDRSCENRKKYYIDRVKEVRNILHIIKKKEG